MGGSCRTAFSRHELHASLPLTISDQRATMEPPNLPRCADRRVQLSVIRHKGEHLHRANPYAGDPKLDIIHDHKMRAAYEYDCTVHPCRLPS